MNDSTHDGHESGRVAVLQAQIDDLRDALDAIRSGGVDAVISGVPGKEQVYTLVSADLPYRLLLEEMNEGAFTASDRGVVLYANPRMRGLLGHGAPTPVGGLVDELVEPGDRDTLRDMLALLPGEHAREEVTICGSDGSIPVLAAASCLDLEGTGVHCFVVTDLRPQKVVEASLRANARRLGQFLDAVPLGVRVTDAHSISHYVNAAARTMLEQVGLAGAEAGELEGAYVRSSSGERVALEELPLARALHGEDSHTDELDLRGPTGLTMQVELWGSSVREDTGQVEFGVVAMADVTVRRRSQELIGEQATLLDLAHDAVMVWDEEDGVSYWNHGAELTYGHSREAALGRPVHELLRTTFPQSREQIMAALVAEGQWEGELEQVDASGRHIVVDSRWARHRGSDGKRAGILEVDRDVTERRTAEVALAEKIASLARANLELKRSNEDLEQFAYAASHDLAEPLRAISLPITLLSRRYAGQLDDDADTYIEFVVDGCARMQQLIDSLLVYSRVGRLEGNLRPVDIAHVVDGVLRLLGPTIEERGAVVTTGELPTVVAEPDQMIQVFQNLISNALKFVAAGTAPVATVGAERRGELWRFTVDDNGIGIEPGQRARVFGMFKRLQPRDEYPGTGIGLALVKKIVERHGGDVGIEDAPAGTGCRFWFTLPATNGAPEAPAEVPGG